MHLTNHTDYALRMLIYLALAGDRRSTIGAIARAYGISENHLMKVSQHLVRAGWVESTRGRGGGLTLRRRPEDIVVGRVVRDMETGFDMAECHADGDACLIMPYCRLHSVLEEAVDAFLGQLDRHTLADLLPPDASKGLKHRLLAT